MPYYYKTNKDSWISSPKKLHYSALGYEYLGCYWNDDDFAETSGFYHKFDDYLNELNEKGLNTKLFHYSYDNGRIAIKTEYMNETPKTYRRRVRKEVNNIVIKKSDLDNLLANNTLYSLSSDKEEYFKHLLISKRLTRIEELEKQIENEKDVIDAINKSVIVVE